MNKEEIVKSLNKVYENSSDSHNIYTPLELCEEMINSLSDLNGDKSILVISNLEFLIVLKTKIKLDNVHYTTSCDIKKQVALSLGLNQNNIHNLLYNKEINLGIEDMKFDYVVMNPPYGKLHIPFLKLATEITFNDGQIISIQPITKLQTNVFKEDLSWLKPTNIKVIKSVDATNLFNAKFVDDLGIIYIDKTDYLFDINQLKYYNNYYNQINELRTSSLHEYYSSVKNGNYFIEFNIIHGHGNALDEYELFSATKMEINKECKGRPGDKRRLYFNTELEANNFIKSCRNITYYFIRRLGTYTTTTIPMVFMPFMEDYTKVWTDKDYCDYFKINYDDVKNEMSKYIPQVKKSYLEYEPNI